MRRALQDSRERTQQGVAVTHNIPAPVGGLNTRDSVAELDPTDATELNNWVVQAGELTLRGGSELWASGFSNPVKSIFQYFKPGVTTTTLFCATDDGIYDFSTGLPGAVGALKIALTDGYINGVNFVNSAGTAYWWGCNGADDVKLYDGTTWSTVSGAITGVSTALASHPWLFKHRVFFVEKNTLNAWFLPRDSIQGAATRIALGNFFSRGGNLIAGTSWTLDAGDGADDLCVFLTDRGEMAIYKGTDPSSASSWALVGVYFVGKPIGTRPFLRMGADVGVLVESGFYTLSALLKGGNVNFRSALTSKIQTLFTSAVRDVGLSAQGWEAVLYPPYDALLINVPAATGSYQLVFNTVTGAWSTFSAWNAQTFYADVATLYFGVKGGTTATRAWDGVLVADYSADIVTTAKQASAYFGNRTMLKRVGLFRPLLAYEGNVETRWGMSADFGSAGFNSIYDRGDLEVGAVWDVAPWNTSSWGPATTRYKNWRAVRHNPGYALSLWLQTASKNSMLSWSGTDFIVSRAGAL